MLKLINRIRRNFMLLALGGLVLALSACGGGGGAPGTTSMSIAPSALTVSEVDSRPIILTVFDSAGALEVFSSHQNLLAPRIEGNTIVVENGVQGRCVTGNTPVTLSVLDANRSLATSVITIQEVGLCLRVQFNPVTLSPAVTTVAMPIEGGREPFQAVSSDTAVVTAAINGRVLTLTRGATDGTAEVTVTDNTPLTPQRSIVTVTNNP